MTPLRVNTTVQRVITTRQPERFLADSKAMHRKLRISMMPYLQNTTASLLKSRRSVRKPKRPKNSCRRIRRVPAKRVRPMIRLLRTLRRKAKSKT